ncbi:MAG: hypothetical protein IKF14_13795 [Atopobiaceae bacterium]|nr:hypothetical protein [Atopobiaceae bacterium]
MARIESAVLPDKFAGRYKYQRYLPIIDKFLDSGMDVARVVPEEGDVDGPEVLPTRLKSAIMHHATPGAVKVCVRKGSVFLVRIKQDDVERP